MAGRTAVQEHGRKARTKVTVETGNEGETEETVEPTQAEIDRQAAADRERSVMEGGPGVSEQQESEWKAFKYGDREFKTQEELTSYIDDLQRRRDEPVRQEVQTQQRQEPAKAQERKRAGDSIDFDRELYTDPRKVFGQFRDELTSEIRQELAREYQADQTIKQFWTDFYTKNKDMQGKDLLVNAVFQRDLKDIGDLPIPKAIEQLASRVREESLKLTGERGARDGESSRKNRTLVEGGGPPMKKGGGQGERQGTEEREIPRSLSALIRQRQDARRNIQHSN